MNTISVCYLPETENGFSDHMNKQVFFVRTFRGNKKAQRFIRKMNRKYGPYGHSSLGFFLYLCGKGNAVFHNLEYQT